MMEALAGDWEAGAAKLKRLFRRGRRGTGLAVQVVQWKAEIASWAAHGAKYQAPPANRTPGQNSSWGFT